MCTVQQNIMITLLKSLLAKELITQDTYDKATEAVFNTLSGPTYSIHRTIPENANPLQGTSSQRILLCILFLFLLAYMPIQQIITKFLNRSCCLCNNESRK